MRQGGYVRYDFKTSTKILNICETLINKYARSLNKLHEDADDKKDLGSKLLHFYGIGSVTMNIFLRELRPYWEKDDPEPLSIVKKIARILGIVLDKYKRKSLGFVRIEAALIRLRRSDSAAVNSIIKRKGLL